ncbi:MAG: NifB/NifX family molybdenum-iron cluster-binding protein [Candidatus Aminicenantes bacterium]|nr:NifB/NifX family molybdenum-iron cluster-binding protein [Candidatus Aminicenantes bacterium]
MKIAISTENNQVSAHFGRCPNYTLFEAEDKKVTGKTVIDTPGHQPGVLPGFLNEHGVNYVIAGGMGPRAQDLFRQMNIEPIIGITGCVDDVVQAFLNGTLQSGESLCTQNSQDHHECRHD